MMLRGRRLPAGGAQSGERAPEAEHCALSRAALRECIREVGPLLSARCDLPVTAGQTCCLS